ncbi:MAG: DUF167 family protein [Caulobacter sp.]
MAARIAIRLTPRGGRDRIDGWDRDGEGRPYLKARVSAPPEDGKANAALVVLLAKALGVPKSAVKIASGQTARLKQIEIEGLETDETMRRLVG